MYFEAVFNPSENPNYSTDAQNLAGKKIAIQAGWVIKEGQFKGQECYYIPNSTIGLIPVCDLDELENGMPRKEGTFGALYWWVVKLGQGLALVLGGFVLKYIGFDGNAATQTVDTMTNLRIADIVIPVITAGLAIWVMWKYSLSEERAKEITAQLEERRGVL